MTDNETDNENEEEKQHTMEYKTNGEVGAGKTALQKLGAQFSRLFYGDDKREENTGGQSKCKNLSCPKPENQWQSKQLKSGNGLCPICLAIKAAEENKQ